MIGAGVMTTKVSRVNDLLHVRTVSETDQRQWTDREALSDHDDNYARPPVISTVIRRRLRKAFLPLAGGSSPLAVFSFTVLSVFFVDRASLLFLVT